MDESILVTGGAGFIGSHACLSLLENGYKVLIIDSLENSSLKIINNLNEFAKNKNYSLEFFKGDIRQIDILEELFNRSISEGKPIKSVAHFAGVKSVFDSLKNPIEYWEKNVFGTLNLIKVMERFCCRNLVFSSSATVYGNNSKCPIPENADIKPINCYGSTKAAIEKLLWDIYKSNPDNWKICVLRYFNPIGAHPSGLFGENSKAKPSNIFPNICDAAFYNSGSLKIFGKDWPTHDGTCIRDYIHVVDLALGHIAALEYLKKNNPQFIPINLGTGRGTSILELIKTFEEVNNIKLSFNFSERRIGDSAISFADNKFAINNLNWKPNFKLSDMCKHGWEYRKNNFNS